MKKYIDADALMERVDEIRPAWLNTLDVVKKVIDDMPAADVEPVRKWISVKDRMPEHGERTLIYAYDGHIMRTSIATYAKKGNGWILSGTTAYWIVKAWMPLPEPPKMDGGSE